MKLNGKRLIALLAVLCMVIAQCGVVVAEDVPECPNSPTGKHIIDHYVENPDGEEGVNKTTAPTCTEPGTLVGVCQYCGQIPEHASFIVAQPLGHDYKDENETKWEPEPTCCKPGIKVTITTHVCTRCGDNDNDYSSTVYEDVPATGVHNFGGEKQPIGVVPEATCVEGGTYEKATFCQNAGCTAYDPDSVEEVVVEALGHDPADPINENVVPSTCTAPGSADEVVYCKRCHIELSRKPIALELKPHDEAAPVPELIQAATCMDYAKYDLVYKCKNCGIEVRREYNLDDADRVEAGLDPYYYPRPQTERPGLMDHNFIDLDKDNPNYVAPTCYSEGTGVFFCSICGQKNETRKIPRLEHTYGEEYTVPATCTTKGAIMKECLIKECKEAYDANPKDNATHYLVVKELEIDPEAHKWVLAPEDPEATPESAEGHDKEEGSATRLPTCTKQGVNAWVCEYNNAHRYAEQVPALDHIYFTLPAIPAECKNYEEKIGGWTAGMLCIRLNKEETKCICDANPAGEIPAAYLEALEVADPATAEAINELGGLYNVLAVPEETEPLPHTRLIIKTPDSATCTEPGQITYYCAVCGKEVTEETPAKKHKWFRVEEDDQNATCIDGGYASFRCENCGEEKREYIPATGEHNFSEWIEQPATCKEAGRIYRVCYTCLFEDIQEFLPIDPEAHQWEIDWSNIKKWPTCTEPGIGGQKCTICGETKYGRIDPFGHDPIEIGGIEPTCTEAGLTSYVICASCYEELEAPEVIPALGHTPGEPVKENVVEPTETEPGSYDEVVYCTVCEAELSREKKEIPLPKNGLAQDEEGKWHYYKDDEIDTTKTGIVEFQGGEFWVVKGDLAEDANGLTICPDGKAYFLAQGQIQRKDGFAEYMGEWFIIKNGMLDETANGLYDYDGSQFVFAAGKLLKNVNGLWQNPKDDKWYFLANGQVQNYSGVAEYNGEFFVLKNGVLDSDYNGTIVYDGKTFIVVNGQLYDEVV